METQRLMTRRRAGAVGLGVALLALALTGAGCADTWQYDWGSYEKSVWLTYAPPSDKGADVGQQIDKLAKEIQKSEAKAKPNQASRVPPGKYAQLGFLYAQQGDSINARQCFEAEKRLYPEATRFIDGLLARMP
jgi:hypothetical protein